MRVRFGDSTVEMHHEHSDTPGLQSNEPPKSTLKSARFQVFPRIIARTAFATDPVELYQVEHKCFPMLSMQTRPRYIKPLHTRGYLVSSGKDCIGVIEHRIDWVGGYWSRLWGLLSR